MTSSPVCQSVRPLCLIDFDSAASACGDTNLVCYVVVGDDVDADDVLYVDIDDWWRFMRLILMCMFMFMFIFVLVLVLDVHYLIQQ